MTEQERLIVTEVAERLRVSPGTVRRMVRNGELAGVKIGRQILIKASEVDRVLEEGTRPIPMAGGRMFPRNTERS